MATRSEVPGTDRLKEVVKLLKLALEDCHRLLAQAERDVHESKQDNDPPQVIRF
jgi:hypothetical protein